MSALKKLPPRTNHSGVELLDLTFSASFEGRVIGVIGNVEPSTILDYALTTPLRHFCHPDTPTYEQELDTAALMIQDPELFVRCPLSSVLSAKNVGIKKEKTLTHFEFLFSAMKQKHEMLTALQEFLRQNTRATSLISEILISADELFTNAVINAPLEAGDPEKINPRPELSEIYMGPGMNGKIAVAVGEERIVLTCQDPYGSLNLKRLVGRIKSCYLEGIDRTLNMTSGGAGIGSYMVYAASSSYYAAVRAGECTLIVSSFPSKISNRKRIELAKNVHLSGF